MVFENVTVEDVQRLIKNKNIKIISLRSHSKASESYVDVIFTYPSKKFLWEGAVPTEYRRTGVHLETAEEIAACLENVYLQLDPANHASWAAMEDLFWKSANKAITQEFFDKLKDHKWKCAYCELPKNPNWARRTQDIKEFGYTISTHTKMFCKSCGKNRTHLILLPLKRTSETGYETIPPALRKKILVVLDNFDVYECRQNSSLLPDHKFPEIRWDEKTRVENSKDMSDAEIKKKFQLLSNQRNQQKREVCRKCYQTGMRGFPYGIKFFYKGSEQWPKIVPRNGREAEKGCIGCGWYDLDRWRTELDAKRK